LIEVSDNGSYVSLILRFERVSIVFIFFKCLGFSMPPT
jgi:hypothetical protein